MERREGYAPGWGRAVLSMMGQRTAETRAGFVLPYLPAASRVVDVGCGPGSITVGLAGAAPSGWVLGVDREVSQVELARVGCAGVGNVVFAQASAYELPVSGGSVDVVFSHALLEHLARPVHALAEFGRTLRPGGVVAVCCSDWSGAYLEPVDADVALALRGHYLLRRRAGGDPFRGRTLARLVADAGFVELTTRRVDRVDMTYSDLARWVGHRIRAALDDPDVDHVVGPGDRATLEHAERAARRWATRSGRATQCWIEVTARRRR